MDDGYIKYTYKLDCYYTNKLRVERVIHVTWPPDANDLQICWIYTQRPCMCVIQLPATMQTSETAVVTLHYTISYVYIHKSKLWLRDYEKREKNVCLYYAAARLWKQSLNKYLVSCVYSEHSVVVLLASNFMNSSLYIWISIMYGWVRYFCLCLNFTCGFYNTSLCSDCIVFIEFYLLFREFWCSLFAAKPCVLYIVRELKYNHMVRCVTLP